MNIRLRIRRYPDHANLCDVWLIRPSEGGSQAGLLHGTMTHERATELVESLGIPATWEEGMKFSPLDPELQPEARAAKCEKMQTLF